MQSDDFVFDENRSDITGLDEAIFCYPKSVSQINMIALSLISSGNRALFTRLDNVKYKQLSEDVRKQLTYTPESMTGVLGRSKGLPEHSQVALVTAGSSDMPVAFEAYETLKFYGIRGKIFTDVGVAGLWRLQKAIPSISEHQLIIAFAGMDAALPTVLGGLVMQPIIGVPTSTGYGVAEGGHSALNSMLSSCSPGLTVVNINNGFGAACAAIKILHQINPC